jgi:hypothetical protein
LCAFCAVHHACDRDRIRQTRVFRRARHTAMRKKLYACLFLLGLQLIGPASAQGKNDKQDLHPLMPLPELKRCSAASHPQLPAKWRASFLMAPFTNAQLMLSDIVHDGSLPATHFKIYGLRRGRIDLLVHGSETYVLTPQAGGSPHCEGLGDTGWRPLPQDWLSPQSQCAGSAPLGEIDVNWWKTPIEPTPSTYWVWYKNSDATPFRLAFQSASDRLGVLSRYALSYQLRFEPSSDIQLNDIVAACHDAKPMERSRPRVLEERIAAMSSTDQRADREIQQLVPELAVCPASPLPRWPNKLAITGLMTPWDANENPYGTEVAYDWTIRAQRTRIFPYSQARFVAQDALLLGPHGYNVTHRPNSQLICTPVLPGTVRPDWPSRGPCSCEAMLTGTTALTPYGTTRVFTCPLASPRAAWAWYALDGRPTSFAVTSLRGDQGFGLFAVLDYRDWVPGYETPRSAFKKPAQCQVHDMGADTARCSTCHLGNAPR